MSATQTQPYMDPPVTPPPPISNSLCCKERLEDVGLHLGRNSWSVIANLNYNATVVAVGSNSQLSFSAHGIDGIVDDVGPHLVEFAPERIHQQRYPLVVALYSHSLLQFMVENRERSFQALHDIDALDRGLVHVGVFLYRTDQIGDPRRTTLDFMQQTRHFH